MDALLGAGPQWVPLLEVVRLLHHPNFYWGAMGGLTNCKYLDLRIDTRDCKCLVRDRDGRTVTLERIREGLEKPTRAEMNENPSIEIAVLSSPNIPIRHEGAKPLSCLWRMVSPSFYVLR